MAVSAELEIFRGQSMTYDLWDLSIEHFGIWDQSASNLLFLRVSYLWTYGFQVSVEDIASGSASESVSPLVSHCFKTRDDT